MSESESDKQNQDGGEVEVEYLKCPCKECGNNIEYPVSSARTTITCPHCGEWTELDPGGDSDEPRTNVNILALAVWIGLPLIIIAGLVFFIRHSSSVAEDHPHAPPQKIAVAPPKPVPIPAPTNPSPIVVTQAVAQIPSKPRPKSYTDLKASAVKLEKAGEGNLLVAVGTVTNDSDYQRFGVVVELNLLDTQGKTIGTARDQIAIMEPHKEWHFHGMVIDSKPASARLSSLKEED